MTYVLPGHLVIHSRFTTLGEMEMKRKLCHSKKSPSPASLSNEATLNKNDNASISGQPTLILNKQSNHGRFYLPPSVSHLVDPPFYMAVAHWGLLLQYPFSRDDLAKAFRVTPRRAADIMSYIMTDRKDVIQCVRHLCCEGHGGRHLRLEITGVSEHTPAVRMPPPPPRKNTLKDDIKALRTLFLTGSLSRAPE